MKHCDERAIRRTINCKNKSDIIFRRIVIVTSGQIGSNPRVVKEADALVDAGYDVTVVSTRTLDIVDERDEALLKRVKWRGVRVDLRNRYVWRYHRFIQTANRLLWKLFGSANLASGAISPFTTALDREAGMIPADLYIAHYPPALPVVYKASLRHSAKYAYDAEDFHPGDWPDRPEFATERRLVQLVEGRYLPGCAYITAASPGIADAYASLYPIAGPTVILNTFPLSRRQQQATSMESAVIRPSIYWFSQTVGPNRGIECAVRAIGKACTSPNLYLRGTPSAGYADYLLALAKEVGAAGRLHFLPPADPDSMEQLASIYDLGLCSETEISLSRCHALTNKLFTYIVAGVPPIMTATPAQKDFARLAGLDKLLYPVDDCDALAVLLDKILGDQSVLLGQRFLVAHLARDLYNWSHDKARLVSQIEQAMSE